MELHDFLMSAMVLLAVLTVATQVFQRLGLGSVLGTLAAGVVLGPWGVNLAHDVEKVRSFTELGVVFLMFTVGLEMDPRKLRQIRRMVAMIRSVPRGSVAKWLFRVFESLLTH